MTDPTQSGWNDPSNRQKREARRVLLDDIAKERAREAQPLLDDLKKFGLHYERLHELVDEPKNTFAITIARMVEYLEIFKDEVNLNILAMVLCRPEGKGIVAKPMLKHFEAMNSKDGRYQAAKAIRATAESDDIEAIESWILNPAVHISSRRELLSTVSRLSKDGIAPLLLKCLNLDEETAIESLKRLKKYPIEDLFGEVRKLTEHQNFRIRKMASEFLPP